MKDAIKVKIIEMTKEELLELKNFRTKKLFSSIIIVPTGEIHESGYMCMKYILCNNYMDEIVGVVGGYCDVMHINGIMAYKKEAHSWSIDCLPKSGCLRIFSHSELELPDYETYSDFMFWVKGQSDHDVYKNRV